MDPTAIFIVKNAKRCREFWEELDEELGKMKANKTCRNLLEDVLGSSNYVMDVDLQDFAKTSRSGLLLRRDGLFVVIAGNHTDRSLLHIPLAHEHESTIGDDRFAWFMNDSSTVGDNIDAAVAMQRLKAIVEPSWKEHGVGRGSVIANLAARAVVAMFDGAGRGGLYAQQEGLSSTTKTLKSAKNTKNSLCATFPQVFTNAIRLLLEKHQRASLLFQFDTEDPLVEEIQKDAIRIDAQFCMELLQVLTASGSPLRHGVVIVRPADTDAGFRIVSVTRRPIVVGCQEPTPVFEVPGARRKALEWLSRLTPATFVVVGEEPAGDFDKVRRLER